MINNDERKTNSDFHELLFVEELFGDLTKFNALLDKLNINHPIKSENFGLEDDSELSNVD